MLYMSAHEKEAEQGRHTSWQSRALRQMWPDDATVGAHPRLAAEAWRRLLRVLVRVHQREVQRASGSVHQVMPPEGKVEPDTAKVALPGQLKPRKYDKVAATYGRNRDGIHETGDERCISIDKMELDHIYRLRSKLMDKARKASEEGEVHTADDLWREVVALGRELGRRGIAPKAKRRPVEAEADRRFIEQCELTDQNMACPHCAAPTSSLEPTCENCGGVTRPDLIEARGNA
jgi:hypothetical protein